MTGPTNFQVAFNYFMLILFWGFAVFVFWDTRRRGRPLSESVAWFLFTGVMFPVAIFVYIYFIRKKLI